MPTFSACVDTKRHLVKIYSELVEISSEFVEISSELVSTILELLIISTFKIETRSVSGIFVSSSMALKADG